MAKNYIIVGRDVGQPAFWLIEATKNEAQQIVANKTEEKNNGIALTVGYIGDTIIKLSERDPRPEKNSAEYLDICDAIKHALMVLPADGGDPATDPPDEDERRKILAAVKVELKYDTRTDVPGETDINTRILVVPASGTLNAKALLYERKEAEARATAKKLGRKYIPGGFKVPLTYPLDETLRHRAMKSEIEGLLDTFEINDLLQRLGTGQTPQNQNELESTKAMLEEIKQELIKYLQQELIEKTNYDTTQGHQEQLSRQAILDSPVLAFKRGVGIYVTEMCH